MNLSLGIAVSLLIGLSAWEEYSFDTFHRDAKQIYRIYGQKEGDSNKHDETFWVLGDQLPSQIGDIKGVCRIMPEKKDLRINQEIYPAIRVLEGEENFFTFFSFPLKAGEPSSCLDDPYAVVISEAMAKRWFPGENPIGKIVNIAYTGDFKVSAIMQDIPYHSHIQADVVIPFFMKRQKRNFGDIYYTYLNIPVIKDKPQLEKRITDLNNRLLSWLNWSSLGMNCKLEALEDIHFSGLDSDHSGNQTYLNVAILATLLVLAMGTINFVNLFISTAFLRAKEVGIKKVMGNTKGAMIRDFYSEAFYYIVLATLLGIFIAVLFLPLFNQLTGNQLVLDRYPYRFYGLIAFLIPVLVLCVGTFPAFYMTRFNVTDTLNRNFKGNHLSFLQKTLLIVQFVCSIFFLLLTFFIQEQVGYMVDYDLGINKENVICLDGRRQILQNYEAIRNELLKETTIRNVCVRNNYPTIWADGFLITKVGTDEKVEAELCEVQGNYFDLMEIPFISGECAWKDIEVIPKVVINETGIKLLGISDPLSASVQIWNESWQICGVVKDVRDKGVEGKVGLQVYIPLIDWRKPDAVFSDYKLMIKVAGDPDMAVRQIKKQWDLYASDVPFEYSFLNRKYEQLYDTYRRTGEIFGYTMLIMLWISISGLFALACYATQRRVKEIGIRKVNGAKMMDLLLLLNGRFLKWVFIAWGIACILAWWGTVYWLSRFEVRIPLNGWTFVWAGAIAWGITWVTVSALTWRVARMNSVNALRSE